MMRPSTQSRQTIGKPPNSRPPVKRKLTPHESFYFKILLKFINQQLGPQEKKFDMSHIENPTAAFIQRCFVSIIEGINERPITQIAAQQPLTSFNSNQISTGQSTSKAPPGAVSANRAGSNPQRPVTVHYNATVDNIYWHAKSFFPEDSSLLNYTILLAPAKDINGTYHALSYLVAFMVFCDGIFEKFKEITGELNLENKQKTDLCSEIEDIKEKIANKLTLIHEAEQEMPLLEAMVNVLKEETQNLEQESSDLNRQIANDKAKYDKAVEENKHLEQFIEHHLKDKINVQNQIVPDANEFLQCYAEQKLALETAHNRKDDLEVQLKKLSTEDQLMHNVIDVAKTCINVFEELIHSMEKLADDTKLCSEIAHKIKLLDADIKEKTIVNAELKNSENQIYETHSNQRKSHQLKMAERNTQLEQLKCTVSDLDRKKALVSAATEVCQKHKFEMETKISEIKTTIEECDFYCKYTFQEQVNEMTETTQKIVAGWRDGFMEIINNLGVIRKL